MDVTQILYDLKFALRRFVRAPGFTVTALTVMALGIAANVAVFSIADAVLLKPPAFPDADRIVVLGTATQGRFDIGASPAMYGVWRKQADVFQDVTALQSLTVTYAAGDVPEQLQAARVSADYFRLFGAHPAAGRTFSVDEDRPGGRNVAVLSHGLWTRRFGSRGDIIGQSISLNGAPHTIVGILDAAFNISDLGPAPDVWIPLQLEPDSKTQGYFFAVAGRLAPGVTLVQARSRLQLATNEFRREYPDGMPRSSVFAVERIQDALVRNARLILIVLLGAAAFVLLIACSNVSGLLLLHAAGRAREIAVRAALGAGRARIVRQLLTESVLLSMTGGAIGVLLGRLAVRLFLSTDIPRLPRLDDVSVISLDWRIVTFAVGTSILTGVLVGLVPTLHISRADLSHATKSDVRTTGGRDRRRAQSLLIIVQVSLAVVLLVGSVLFIRTVSALSHVDPGFDPHHVLTLRTSLADPRFATATQVAALIQRGTDALRAVPGVAVVGTACALPLEGGAALPFVIAGRPLPGDRQWHGGAGWLAVSAGYFEAMKIRVLRGRTFTERDVLDGPPVAIIDEIMARQYWPDGNPIGEHVVLGHGVGPQFQDEPPREIVGVVASVRGGRLEDKPGAHVYEPQGQLPDAANAFITGGAPMAWIVRTTPSPESLVRPLEDALRRSTQLPVSNVRTMDEVVQRSMSRARFGMWLTTVFSAVALSLAAIGLYGLIGYSVEQRTQEIGIRLALGANASQVRTVIVWHGLRLALAGTILGLLAAFALARVLAQMLYGVTPSDPTTFAAVALLVFGATFLATWLPARRASRIDPIRALRYE
jgi:putative ABC transport system permease protein